MKKYFGCILERNGVEYRFVSTFRDTADDASDIIRGSLSGGEKLLGIVTKESGGEFRLIVGGRSYLDIIKEADEDDIVSLDSCDYSGGEVEVDADEKNNLKDNSADERKESANSTPSITLLFYALAWISLVGGIVLCGSLWPGDPGRGMQWNTVAYMPSLMAFAAGVVQFAIYVAIGEGLAYLRAIMLNTAK